MVESLFRIFVGGRDGAAVMAKLVRILQRARNHFILSLWCANYRGQLFMKVLIGEHEDISLVLDKIEGACKFF